MSITYKHYHFYSFNPLLVQLPGETWGRPRLIPILQVSIHSWSSYQEKHHEKPTFPFATKGFNPLLVQLPGETVKLLGTDNRSLRFNPLLVQLPGETVQKIGGLCTTQVSIHSWSSYQEKPASSLNISPSISVSIHSWSSYQEKPLHGARMRKMTKVSIHSWSSYQEKQQA